MLNDICRNPMQAAVLAACITAGYVHAKSILNQEGKLPLYAYTKPAILVSILVYFIVDNGLGKPESISLEPY